MKAHYADLITRVLVEAGLTVVPPSDVGPVIDAATKQLGGLFDPVTGKLDEAKAKAVDAAVGKELRARFNADAFLEPSVRVVLAKFSNDEARWHGTQEGTGKGFWKAVLLQTHSGEIPALSLFVFLTDAQGARLYAKPGGIQVIGKVTFGGKFENRPRSELFADEERVVRSVHVALDELLKAPEKVPKDAPPSAGQ